MLKSNYQQTATDTFAKKLRYHGLLYFSESPTEITHTHTRARTHARTHAHTHTRTHAHTHTHTKEKKKATKTCKQTNNCYMDLVSVTSPDKPLEGSFVSDGSRDLPCKTSTIIN